MSEAKCERCACGKMNWSDRSWVEFVFCPFCGKQRPASTTETSPIEDERMALELDRAHDLTWDLGDVRPWEDSPADERARMMDFLAKARELLTPAAYADGKRDGMREALGILLNHVEKRFARLNVIRRSEYGDGALDAFMSVVDFATEQRDACGPAKAEQPSGVAVPSSSTDMAVLRAENERLKAQVTELAQTGESLGWNGADNSKILSVFFRGIADERDDLRAKLAEARKEPVGLTMAKDAARREFDDSLKRPSESSAPVPAAKTVTPALPELGDVVELLGDEGSWFRASVYYPAAFTACDLDGMHTYECRLSEEGTSWRLPGEAIEPRDTLALSKKQLTSLMAYLDSIPVSRLKIGEEGQIIKSAARDQAAAVEAATKELRERIAELEKKLADFHEAAGDAQGIDEENHHLRLQLSEAVRERDANAKAAVELEELRDLAPKLRPLGSANLDELHRFRALLRMEDKTDGI